MQPRRYAAVLVLVFFGLVGSGVRAGSQLSREELFTLNDLLTIIQLSAPALSPDGTQAAMVVSRPDLGAEKGVINELVTVDLKTGSHRVMAAGQPSAPAWSPRGDLLAWLAPDSNGTSQVHAMSAGASDREPAVVTRTQPGAGVQSFAWGPTGEYIAYLAEEPQAPPVGHARFDKSFEIPDADRLGTSYRALRPPPGPARVWLVSSHGGVPRNLTPGSANITQFAWRPDGEAVVVSSQPGSSLAASRASSIRSVDIESGRETILVGEQARVGDGGPLEVSHRGRIAYRRFGGLDPWNHINQAAIVGEAGPQGVTRGLDRDVMDLLWLPDATTLLVRARDRSRVGLWTVSTESQALESVDLGDVTPVSELAASGSGLVAFIGSEPGLPPELYVMQTVAAMPVRRTSFNASMAGKRLGRVEIVRWQSEGFEHTGVITYPPGFREDRKYPMYVRIHGGPESSAIASFNARSQFFAANGWIVFEPNYRGSTGHGNAYQTAIVGDSVAGSGRDIMAGVEALRKMGIVDERRIAVGGWSWGGKLTVWLTGQHDGWCAAMPGGMTIDLEAYYTSSEYGFYLQTLLGSPFVGDNRSIYLEQSPASYVNDIATPTLIIHNAGDPNAPITDSYWLYHALRDRAVKSRFVVRGVEGHGIGLGFHSRDVYLNELAWLQNNCAGGDH